MVRKKLAAVLAVVALVAAPVASADVPQCQQPVFARTNPALCDNGQGGSGGPFPPFPGGGGDDGGLIGAIGRALHGLTGGLL